MASLPVLFLNNLLPVFLAAGAGVVLARRLQVEPRPISQAIFYIFSPCLVFTLLIQSRLTNGDILRMVGFNGLIAVLTGLLAFAAGRLMRLDRRTLAAVLLTTMFVNAGNFGLPVIQFAFGDTALAFASLYFVANSILAYTLGVVIASLGSMKFSDALLNLFKVPTVYAVALALVFVWTGWKLPLPLERTTTLLGEAALPSMLLVLGLQFPRIQLSGNLKPLALVNGLRLLAGPLLALAVNLLLGLQGPARQAGILQSAMPAAVLTTVLATEYDVEPSFVTAVVFTTTLLSAFTLTVVLNFLGGLP